MELMANESHWPTTIKMLSAEDDLVGSWMLVSSPGAIFAVLATYLVFVKHIGPKMMERRKPFQLKFIMQSYNLAQILWNLYIVLSMITRKGVVQYFYNHSCTPMEDNPLRKGMCISMWHYTALKFFELFDTVFFVLRKKQDHVSFLHVYHHTAMALLSWSALKYMRGEQGILLGFQNSLVHVVLYTYYFLAATGERMRPYLWWKRYLTTLQIIQLVVGAVFLSSLIVLNCKVHKAYTCFLCSQFIIFIALFVNFYNKAYFKHPPVKAH